MMISSMRSKKLNVGLWIDLTNTNRYYELQNPASDGIEYVKLRLRGHGECPKVEQVQEFINLCRSFHNRRPNFHIAVHCTHGFNRTGFLICAFLVDELGWDIEAAIQTFSKSRPPGIYKSDYLEELGRRYGPIESVLEVPERPDWCNEDSQYEDDDSMVQNGHSAASTSAQNDPTLTNPHPGVFLITDNDKIHQVQRMCVGMCSYRRNDFPGAHPVSLTQENIILLAQNEYLVSWKADGTRYMMLIMGAEMYFFDRDFRVFQLINVKFLKRSDSSPLTNTLIDGEMVADIVDGRSTTRFLIYDIIYFDGQDVKQNNFRERLNIIFKEIITPRENGKRTGAINRETEPIGIRIKDFCELEKTVKYFSPKFTRGLSHEIDGLIFQPVSMPYTPGRCDKMLKWKPPSHNSVDFRLCIVKETRPGYVEDYQGQLYVGNLDKPFDYIKVTKALKNYNNKIIECRYNEHNKGWELMRERTDKSYPNAFTTATNVVNSIRNPVTRDFLINYIAKHRFRPDHHHHF